ncbi:EpsG family protein [Leuconostoc carnosum]|uniref:EpsG family protein n=1 Tax=Leuconostoc carnosum TaxID=1252 RepID=UPI001644EF15|nr:EpsG family protein [Leuconostoc carnosum]
MKFRGEYVLYFGQIIINYITGKIRPNAIIPALFGVTILAYYAGTMQPDSSFDTLTYQNYYEQIGKSFQPFGVENQQFEVGFKILNILANQIGLSYGEFRLIFFYLSFFIILLALKKLDVNLSKFIALYSVFPFFSDVTQVRNFLMLSLVLFGYSFLKGGSRKNFVIATCLILIGASIQSFGYLFLIGLFLLRFSTTQLRQILLGLIPLYAVIAITVKLINPSIIIKFIAFATQISGRKSFNTEAVVSGVGVTSAIAYIIISTLLGVLVYIITASDQIGNEKKILLALFLIQFLLFPLIMVSVTSFSRIVRGGFVTVLIICCNKKLNKSKQIFTVQSKDIIFGIVYLLGMITFDGGMFRHSQFAEYLPYILHINGY